MNVCKLDVCPSLNAHEKVCVAHPKLYGGKAFTLKLTLSPTLQVPLLALHPVTAPK